MTCLTLSHLKGNRCVCIHGDSRKWINNKKKKEGQKEAIKDSFHYWEGRLTSYLNKRKNSVWKENEKENNLPISLMITFQLMLWHVQTISLVCSHFLFFSLSYSIWNCVSIWTEERRREKKMREENKSKVYVNRVYNVVQLSRPIWG